MSSTIQLNPNLQKEFKELPHNAEAEQGLLGAILLNNDIADEVSSIIDPNHFFEEIHKNGNTLIIVTHEEEIAQHANRIIRLKDGEIESDTN